MSWEWVTVIAIFALWSMVIIYEGWKKKDISKDKLFVEYFDFVGLRGRMDMLEIKITDRVGIYAWDQLCERVKRLEEKKK